jgi:hypothetical protein
MPSKGSATIKPENYETNQQDISSIKAAAMGDVNSPQSATKRGPIRKTKRANSSSTETSASGRTHEENQERAYIAASRRSDRSIEARLESARRASEIHKRRCGRGLRVTEEAVLNEEMYEEEDPDYEQRVSRLRMAMNIPNYVGYHPYQLHMMSRGSMDGGNGSMPSTPSALGPRQSFAANNAEAPMFFYPAWFQQAAMQVPVSPLSPGVPASAGAALGPMSPPVPAMQSPAIPSTPSTHFLPPTQFPIKKETPMIPKSIAPMEMNIPEHEVVLDPAPLDLFADVNLDLTDGGTETLWGYSGESNADYNHQDWFSQQDQSM